MTKSGKARAKQSAIKYLKELSVLMKDSMVSSLIINHSGDYSKIIGYKGMSDELFSFAFTDSLIFGTNSEATVSLPKSGQSISCHPYPYFRYYRLYDTNKTLKATSWGF
jgi:hypothetical protein